jgi:hypothetical protein
LQGGGHGFESRILHENTTLLATGGASLLAYNGRWASHMQGERTPYSLSGQGRWESSDSLGPQGGKRFAGSSRGEHDSPPYAMMITTISHTR